MMAANWLCSATAQEVPWTFDCDEIRHVQANDELTDFTITKDLKFEITFSRLSEDEWIMVGNSGTVPVVSMPGPGVIQFLEQTSFGTINYTQISLTPKDGSYSAVHSRHPVLIDTMFPSQWLLSCTGR